MCKCRFCGHQCIKKGRQLSRQKLYCKDCNKYQQLIYIRRIVSPGDKEMAVLLNNEGCSISSIARVMRYSKTTVCGILKEAGRRTQNIVVDCEGAEYELDELKTFVGNKHNDTWIIYALNKTTKCIPGFVVGKRTQENIRKLTDALLRLNPKTIFTDRLNLYPALIPNDIHSTKHRSTNGIERMNLHFRQQLRRLQRRTICFSRSEQMLECSVRLLISCLNASLIC